MQTPSRGVKLARREGAGGLAKHACTPTLPIFSRVGGWGSLNVSLVREERAARPGATAGQFGQHWSARISHSNIAGVDVSVNGGVNGGHTGALPQRFCIAADDDSPIALVSGTMQCNVRQRQDAREGHARGNGQGRDTTACMQVVLASWYASLAACACSLCAALPHPVAGRADRVPSHEIGRRAPQALARALHSACIPKRAHSLELKRNRQVHCR